MSTRHSRFRAIARASRGAMKVAADGAAQAQPAIDPAAGDEGVREQEQLIGEKTAKSETQRPNVPTSLWFGIAPEILDRQQPNDSEPDTYQQLRRIKTRHRRTEE